MLLSRAGVEAAAKKLLSFDDPNGTVTWDRLEGRIQQRYIKQAENVIVSYMEEVL